MTSLLLDTDNWDLTVDNNGNIAVASEQYSLAQDAACAVRLFVGELYYDTVQGIPYYELVLGKFPPLSLVKETLAAAAATVPGVVKSQCFIASFVGRKLRGQVQVTDKTGVTLGFDF